VVANKIHLVRVPGVFYLDPHFLVQEVQEEIVKQWCDVGLAEIIVATANNQD